MTNKVECPHCAETLEVTHEVSDYDWDSGVSFKVIAVICPYCHKETIVEATGSVLDDKATSARYS